MVKNTSLRADDDFSSSEDSLGRQKELNEFLNINDYCHTIYSRYIGNRNIVMVGFDSNVMGELYRRKAVDEVAGVILLDDFTDLDTCPFTKSRKGYIDMLRSKFDGLNVIDVGRRKSDYVIDVPLSMLFFNKSIFIHVEDKYLNTLYAFIYKAADGIEKCIPLPRTASPKEGDNAYLKQYVSGVYYKAYVSYSGSHLDALKS